MAPAIPPSRKRPGGFSPVLRDWDIDQHGKATVTMNSPVSSVDVPPSDRYHTFYDPNEYAAAELLWQVFDTEFLAVVDPITNWSHWDPNDPTRHPLDDQKNQNVAKVTDRGQGSADKIGGAKGRVKRAARTDNPPLITGAAMGVYTTDPDHEDEEMSATVQQLGDRTRATCYSPGIWNMALNESRLTSTIPHPRTLATHIPDGSMPASAWDEILAEATRPF
ncbi:hypothetical protein FPOAC1_003875 [Fusarium poae]|uniref:hypothetical protein n=1 Tax=Fusarium poae TaxID=36050 RepID=UPI001CE7ABA5|nr:hypothetical protein FPOAC1_003875 [Fusarium poae]KAG8677847.1 hypothetical protein FPOAC1_003875 [Fusarium poae]